jgi:hypothetical protein
MIYIRICSLQLRTSIRLLYPGILNLVCAKFRSAAADGTPSRQKQPPRVSRVAFGASAQTRLHGNIDAAAQVLDAGTHAGADTRSPERVGANTEWSSAAAGAAVPTRTHAAPREASSSSSSQSLAHRIKNVGQTPDRTVR